MAFTLSAVLTPVYVSRAGFLSGFYYIFQCSGLSQLHLSAFPDFRYRFISMPSALLRAPFYDCEIFAGRSLNHKARGTVPCVHDMQIHSLLSHPFQPGGFTGSCLPLSGSLCWVLFLSFRAWQAEKCDPGSSSRLWSLGRAAHTDANRLEVLII